jgi:hypothetical protein
LFAALNGPEWVGRQYHGTDKVEHGFLPHYRQELTRTRWRRMIVYEIGVGGYDDIAPGPSLQLWRDYFPRATIVGLDIAPKEIALGHRVRFELADQSSPEDLRRVVARHGAPTVVIDDGSHIGEHVRASFEALWPVLRPGGVYVIEDLCASYDPQTDGGDPAPATSAIGLLRELVSDAQGLDPVFGSQHWFTGPKPAVRYADVASVRVYPGIAFIHRARDISPRPESAPAATA